VGLKVTTKSIRAVPGTLYQLKGWRARVPDFRSHNVEAAGAK